MMEVAQQVEEDEVEAKSVVEGLMRMKGLVAL